MNRRLNKKVGVKDIAAKAGVYIGTVDRVLHNRGEVKKETKEGTMMSKSKEETKESTRTLGSGSNLRN